MYVVFAEELEGVADLKAHTVGSLEQAFAQIIARCGLTYYFAQEGEGWKLVFTDPARPDCSPEPVVSDYIKPRDAKHDLMAQAVDGRLKGHIAVPINDFRSFEADAAKSVSITV
jgi:hypothetical protein